MIFEMVEEFSKDFLRIGIIFGPKNLEFSRSLKRFSEFP